ncbi:hypothetical protein THMIRHAM_05390 [Thiomicrorhabdus immobilis]|uniref:Glycosyl transferase family 2 n=1 Tax=Thiomicrorhabdus immobilis TaxID=2791037 RepID=A0ABM7MBS7_9GAMM|nr:glycosyltransferase family 2 protein [Thiomicrorhabdus immobilis]BCN92754.1 hypothetical protein THMIRHAM_05390 [Thiomicrorhabdus immobilis]
MKVKLVAIAKDEAAYIAQWVFHHLHFGFDAIEIHVNRTEDNSTVVLEKIVSQYPDKVSYRNADWVDIAPDCVSRVMQYAVYAEAYQRTKSEGEFTHICFLDIDEFWTPRDFCSSVKSCLESLDKNVSSVSFNWLNVLDEKIAFSSLTNPLKVQPASTVKSIINLKSDVSRVQLHLSEFLDNDHFYGHIMNDGRRFKHSAKERQRLAESEKDVEYPFFILHRMFRTQIEYVSLLYRGNPRGNTPFKMNRPGYIVTALNQKEVMFNGELYAAYLAKYKLFEESLGLIEDLKSAQKNIEARFEDAINRLEEIDTADSVHFDGIKRIFSGVEDSRVKSAIQKLSPTVGVKTQERFLVSRFKKNLKRIF